ncbi:MAG: hypothetical protein Q9162_004082 [Coniocarpon cinnabarinum]
MRVFSSSVSVLLLATSVTAQNTQTSSAAVASAAATAKSSSPTSNVPGAAFDRIAIVWLENTDYDMAAGDPNMVKLAKQGITLTNYFGVTHPSEPNYVASHGGDHFGMDNDNFNVVDGKVSSIVDLLEAKGISWVAYQEDMPYSGFEGYSWTSKSKAPSISSADSLNIASYSDALIPDPTTHANDYVRKHNPPVIYGANNNPDRLSNIKNFTLFDSDLAANTLPQWMFITPNMTNDGHDTSVTTAASWSSSFLTPLLKDPNFTRNTLILLTFDETETYTEQNRVFSLLLGDAVPTELHGTNDDTFYTHYSELSTVEANWNLDTLGRPTVFLNESYPGPLASIPDLKGYAAPNTSMVRNGRKVAQSIIDAWQGSDVQTYYSDTIEVPDGIRTPTWS